MWTISFWMKSKAGMFCVHFIFDLTKSGTNTGSKLIKQHFTEGIPEKGIIKVFNRMPGSDIASATFGDEGMDMWIPL